MNWPGRPSLAARFDSMPRHSPRPVTELCVDLMRPPVATSFTLLAVALICCVSCSSNGAWPPEHYTEVRAFLYNLDSHDSLPCVTDGRLDVSVVGTNGVRLTHAQISRFLAAVTGKHPKHEVAGCYVPHHAYVFYDQKHRIIGWAELCFGCLNYRASSRSAPAVFDIFTLQDLTVELGLPVLKKEADYLNLKPKDSK